MPTAYIALGSNLGDRVKNCERAIEILRVDQNDTIAVLRTSPWYHTKAVMLDGKPQPDYCNGVVAIETNLSPEMLLERCRNVERQLGRVRNGERWQARVIDLDILFYHDIVMTTDTLTIPHPEMTKRLFVLEPLCAIAPDVRHPVEGVTIKELLRRCSAG
ncbi:MAG: 2-amino-4-hydroxy-6-hydroxymethyldihydropteridine diphosphokinase [Deltaproteobacteria bacterium]|nr:2-amino-4-hydroxy-6-hydroxymethyldihydropteridine diphosphokinase [Deltaproteobacteria bacterium]